MIVFEKVYNGEGTHDLGRDSFEAFHPVFNPEINKIPKDKDGFMVGKFTVTIKWEE